MLRTATRHLRRKAPERSGDWMQHYFFDVETPANPNHPDYLRATKTTADHRVFASCYLRRKSYSNAPEQSDYCI